MSSELLLLHGSGGRRKMAKTGCKWKRVINPYTNTWTNQCVGRSRRKKSGLFGEVGLMKGLGESMSLKGIMADVKDVAVNGGVAVAGAVITDRLFTAIMDSVDKNHSFTGIKRHVAEMATGVGLGIAVGKLLKKPRIAVLVAIGPVVVGGLKIVGEMLNSGPFAGSMAGVPAIAGAYRPNLGMMAIEPYRQLEGGGFPSASQPEIAGLGGMAQIGPGTPGWMINNPQLSDSAFTGY